MAQWDRISFSSTYLFAVFILSFSIFQPSEIFIDFDPIPLGTASLAQVHKAKLKSGETVAVKIQHPFVKGNSLVDMKTMEVSCGFYPPANLWVTMNEVWYDFRLCSHSPVALLGLCF